MGSYPLPSYPEKLKPGDKVAVVSPSAGLPADIGHTDPQLIIPYGGAVRVDAERPSITVRY